jgi:hypothetical protein
MVKGNTASADSGFQRVFLIFSNEDGGYEAGQKPSGHVRLEVREGRGKLHAVVQNLRQGNGKFEYKLYLIKAGDPAKAACAGPLRAELNKAALEWSFDPNNVGGSGASINEFDTAPVLVEYAGRPEESVICPLAAYRKSRTEWRNGLRDYFMRKRSQAAAELATEGPGAVPEYPVQEIMQERPVLIMEDFSENGEPVPTDDVLEIAADEGETEDFASVERIVPELMQPDQMALLDHVIQPDWTNQPEQTDQPDQIEQSERTTLSDQTIPPQAIPAQTAGPQDMLYQAQDRVDTGCMYLNGNMCGAFVNNDAAAVNPCSACQTHNGRACCTEPPAGDVSQLKEELDRYFEQCDPFHSHRSDYTWWRVDNPVNLNNMLYQCNIRSPLLFNPAVMMAHYKYRHLIVGIFLHKDREKRYVVCGVPGMSMVDKKPFGDVSKWVQAEGNRPRYGAFGYWLVYIDPDGGKILNMN